MPAAIALARSPSWQFRPAPRRPDRTLTWFQSWLVLHGGSRLANVRKNSHFATHVNRIVRDTIGVAARRSGKTAGALGLTILGGLDDGPGDVGYMAPTLPHAKRLLWRPLTMLLREPAAKRFISGKPNNSELTVEFATGTRLYIYSAEAYERVRGDGFKLFIADEADDPIFTDEVFSDAIRPALSDNLGSLVQLGTPKGRSRLFREWRKGQGIPCDRCKKVPCEHFDPTYASIQVTALEAGLLDPAEVQRAKRTLPDRSFRQEYMAEFNAPLGMVYEEWNEERHVVTADQIPPLDAMDEFIVGVDWGVAKRGSFLVLGVDRVFVPGDDTYEGCDMPRVWAIEEWSEAGKPYTDAGWWKKAREVQQAYRPRYWYCDPAGGTEPESDAKAAGLLRQLQQALATVDNRVQVLPGDNRVGPGINAIQGFVHYDDMLKEPPRLFVTRACPHLIDEFGKYRYPGIRKFEGQDGEEFDEKPVKENDHCIAAGSLVATERGPVPIERIAVGDMVWTRAGLRAVLRAGLTRRSAPTIEVTTESGHTVIGTSDHLVWTENRGWVCIHKLHIGDRLLICEVRDSFRLQSASCSMGCHSADTPTQIEQNCETTSCAPTGTVPACTRRSGSFTTDRFRMDTTSTTKTRTRSTITSTTSNACRPETITGPTSPKRNENGGAGSQRSVGHSRKSGIAAKMAACGTDSTVSIFGRRACQSSGPASSAGSRTTLSATESQTGTVQTTASRTGGEQAESMTLNGRAPNAARCSPRTSTAKPRLVQSRVLSVSPSAKSADVYDMTIDGVPEFFANGILVHNCLDALRYGVYTHFYRGRRRSGRNDAGFEDRGG